VYGSAAFPVRLANLDDRERIAEVIGVAAESTVFLFATTTRASLFANVFRRDDACLHDACTAAQVPVTQETLSALFHVVVANWIEQRRRCKEFEPQLEFLALRRWIVPEARAMVEAQFRKDGARVEVADMPLALLLSWQDLNATERIVAELEDSYLSVLASALHDRIPTELWLELVQLGEGGLRRILQAPETPWRVWGISEEANLEALAHYVEGAVQLERWRNGHAVALRQASWSAEGDIFLPAGYHEPRLLERGLFDPSAAHRAERLENTIVVDFDSPSAMRRLVQNSFRPTTYGPPEFITASEREDLLVKLRGAMQILRFGSPIAYRFVVANVRTVNPRKQSNPAFYPFGFNGSSTATCMGRAVLNNAHYPIITAGHIAQSLLHEAIHIHLYKREFFDMTVKNWAAVDSKRLRSPWSGNQISHYAFAHATLVFYGLASFFSLPAVHEIAGAAISSHYVDLALTGLLADQFDPLLDETASTFSVSMNEHLRTVHAATRKRFPDGPTQIHELLALDDVNRGGA
jgi:hypothetical protein